MTQDEILVAWRKSVKSGDRVRHIAGWEPGTVVGKSTHCMFEMDVDFDGVFGVSPCYMRNLYPEWWPAPEWAKARK